MVRGAYMNKFQAACAEFGVNLLPNQSMNVWFGANDQDSLNEYIMPDSAPLATWLAMKHPEWLHEIWQQGPPVITDDSQQTFQPLQAPNG
jgi:hypothetical protein